MSKNNEQLKNKSKFQSRNFDPQSLCQPLEHLRVIA